jgi:hypothetical protein
MYECILLEATSFLKASLTFYQMAVLRPITPYFSPRREILRNLYNFLRHFSRINLYINFSSYGITAPPCGLFQPTFEICLASVSTVDQIVRQIYATEVAYCTVASD